MRCAISSGVWKWYGSLMIALFKFVGSKQILCLRFPDLSFNSTKTKLSIHGVASVTGFQHSSLQHPVYLFLKCFLQMYWHWTTRCLFWLDARSRCMVEGGPGNLPIPLKTSGYCLIIWVLVCNHLVGPILLHCWCFQGILCIGCCACFHFGLALSGQLLGTVDLHWCLDLLSLLWDDLLCLWLGLPWEAGNWV